MSKYWTTCASCVLCSVDGCRDVAYCGAESINGPGGPALCDTHGGNAA